MSRTCEPWLAARVDAVEGAPSEVFADHMKGCPSCKEAVEDLRLGIDLISPDPSPVPGPWMAVNIRRAAEAKRRRFSGRIVVLVPMAAAAGLLIFLSALSGRVGDSYDLQTMDPIPDPNERAFVSDGDSTPSLDADLSAFAWDDDWGMGVDSMIARADTEDLRRLLENLPP